MLCCELQSYRPGTNWGRGEEPSRLEHLAHDGDGQVLQDSSDLRVLQEGSGGAGAEEEEGEQEEEDQENQLWEDQSKQRKQKIKNNFEYFDRGVKNIVKY